MLHLLRARLAPAPAPAVVPAESAESDLKAGAAGAEGSGALSKVFALWNKKGDGAGASRAKKKLATVFGC